MTLLRKEEYKALKGIALSGSVLDLGGEVRSKYHTLFNGDFTVTTANLGKETMPDVVLDLEKLLPFQSLSYDAVLLINVLEHIFEYQQLLNESARVMKPGGIIIIIVPFLFPYHPSPEDFHRYTASALEQALQSAGFKNIVIKPLGSGVFAAQWVFLERLLPPVFAPLWSVMGFCASGMDALFVVCARILGKKYRSSDYALGYMVTAKK